MVASVKCNRIRRPGVVPGLACALTVAVALLAPARGPAQCNPSDSSGMGGHGPDVVVGEITSPANYGQAGGYYAYSIGTTSCNIGTDPLNWIAGTNDHPVIAQNMYRLQDGRFEHIGMSWLKHGFVALQGNVCGCGCAPHPNGSALGLGCSDPYGASLNGSQGSLGARSEVTPHNGVFVYPRVLNPPISDLTTQRLRVHGDDLAPALNVGALYFVEAQYVAKDDHQSGNGYNNCSYRGVTVSTNPSNYAITYNQPTQRQRPAIQAWALQDPGVILQDIFTAENPAGRLLLGTRVTDNGNGTWSYEYALYNQNSTRGVRSFRLALPLDASLSAIGFHDAEYHSGEPYDGTDWGPTLTLGSIEWSTATQALQPNANALRWGTLYNFRFTADAPPAPVSLDLGYFAMTGYSGQATGVTVSTLGPDGDFLDAVAGLTCTEHLDEAQLSWDLADTYDLIEVVRAGAVVATLPGDATSFWENGLAPGSHTYLVIGRLGPVAAPTAPCAVTIHPPPALRFTFHAEHRAAPYDPVTGMGSFTATISISQDRMDPGFPSDSAAFSVALAHDSTLLVASAVHLAPVVQALNGGTGPEFLVTGVLAEGITVAAIYSFQTPAPLAFANATPVVQVHYTTQPGGLAGERLGVTTQLVFADEQLGNPPVENVLATSSLGLSPAFEPGLIQLTPGRVAALQRGDCNVDGAVNIADAITLLGFLFPAGAPPALDCQDACDGNDDGALDIADAIRILSALFGAPTVSLPAPYPGCGVDPQGDGDGLSCSSSPHCP